MLFPLNTSDDRPIYAQIGDQVKFAVAAGLLRPGELVPSVRELSRQLVVNPNTVARAYRELQGQGVLEPVRGTGLQVAAAAPGALPGRPPGVRPPAAPRGARRGQAERPGRRGDRGHPPRGVGPGRWRGGGGSRGVEAKGGGR